MNKNDYMKEALLQARTAYKKDEVPVGCVIVRNGKTIAKAYNQKEKKKDPTSHAEIECIRKACKKLNKKYLDDSEMYVTLEPCLMCLGAIKEARIKKVYVGAYDPKGGAVVSRGASVPKALLDKFVFVDTNNEATNLLKSFFKSKR